MARKQKTEDLYIEMLRYGRKKLAVGVTPEETQACLRALDPESVLVQDYAFEQIFYPTFQLVEKKKEPPRYTVGMDGYFNLLGYEELQEARQSSRRALRVAGVAIGVSIFASVGSIWVQLASVSV